MATQLNERAGAVAVVRFAGRGFDIPLISPDLGVLSADGQKRHPARTPYVPLFKAEAYGLGWHATGNLARRPLTASR